MWCIKLGHFYLKKEEIKKMIENYSQKLKISLDIKDFYYNKKHCYSQLYLYRDAILKSEKRLKRATSKYSGSEDDIKEMLKDAIYCYDNGECSKELEEYKKALENYTQALKIAQIDEIGFKKIKYYYNDFDEISEEVIEACNQALEAYNRAIELNPNEENYYKKKEQCMSILNF